MNKTKLPRKLKKAAKAFFHLDPGKDAFFVHRYTLAYEYTRDTKWKRKARNWLFSLVPPIKRIRFGL